MRNALSHSLGPVPWSLALADGTLARTAKSKLLQLLEGSEEPSEHVSPSATTYVGLGRDGNHTCIGACSCYVF